MAVVLQRIPGYFTIFGFHDFEVIFEYFARSKPHEPRVIDYQDHRFAGTGFGHLLFETLAYNGQMSAQTDKPLTIRCLGGILQKGSNSFMNAVIAEINSRMDGRLDLCSARRFYRADRTDNRII
jgi:hypothetical protein